MKQSKNRVSLGKYMQQLLEQNKGIPFAFVMRDDGYVEMTYRIGHTQYQCCGEMVDIIDSRIKKESDN